MIFLRTKPASPQRSRLFAGLFPAVSVLPTKFFPDAPKRPPRRAPRLILMFRGALEDELQCELYQARFAGPLYAAKIAPVRSVSVRLVELRMVEHIIDFTAELQFVALSDLGVLEYADIRLKLARPTANCAGRVADGAENNAARHVRAKWIVDQVIGVRRIDAPGTKRVRIESQVSGAARIELLKRCNQVWLTRRFKVETGVQLVVVLLRNPDRKTRCCRCRSGQHPAV